MKYYYKRCADMKRKPTDNWLFCVAKQSFTTMHYKVLMLLLTGKSYTQAQMADLLGVKHRQNLTQPINDLLKSGLVEVDRVEGRNKYLRVVLNVKLDSVDDGQLELLNS